MKIKHPIGDINFVINNETLMSITKEGKFIAKGKEIEDTEGVYKIMVKWCEKANELGNLELTQDHKEENETEKM